MMRGVPIPAAILLLAFLALGGCADPAPEVRFQSAEDVLFGLPDERIAIGGLVVREGVATDDAAPQKPYDDEDVLAVADRWTGILETSLSLVAPGLERWSWTAVSDQADPDLLRRALTVHRRGGLLRADLLTPLAGELPGCRYLLLARVDGNDVQMSNNDGFAETSREGHAGLGRTSVSGGEPGAASRGSYSLRRTITLTMDLYDMISGRSVWSASVERSERELLTAEGGDDGSGFRVEAPSVEVDRSAVAGREVRIEGRGGLAGGPTLEQILPDACDALVDELLQATAPPAAADDSE